jgi:hypothetical protein
MNTIPVIDIAPFLDGTAKGKAAVARAVDDARSTLGFLIIAGHGVPDSLIDDMRRTVICLFQPAAGGKDQAAHAAGSLSRLYLAWERGAVLFAGRRIAAGLQGVVFHRAGRPNDPYHRAAAPGKFFAPICGLNTRRAFGRSGRPITARWNGWRRR